MNLELLNSEEGSPSRAPKDPVDQLAPLDPQEHRGPWDPVGRMETLDHLEQQAPVALQAPRALPDLRGRWGVRGP